MGEPDYGREAFLITDARLFYSYLAPPLLGAGGTVNWGDGEIVATQSLRSALLTAIAAKL